MHPSLILLIIVGLIFLAYVYNDRQWRKSFERATMASNVLTTEGFFQSDDQQDFTDKLFQGGQGTQISTLRLEEPSYQDIDSRFGGTQVAENQALVIKGQHSGKYFSFTVLDSESQQIGVYVPPKNKKFVLVVLRSHDIKRQLDSKYRHYKRKYIFLSDEFSCSDFFSVVIEKSIGGEEKLFSTKRTYVGVTSHCTTLTPSRKYTVETTDFSRSLFEKLTREHFRRNHSIDDWVALSRVDSQLGFSYRRVSDLIDFSENTYINLMTTKQKDETVQFGIMTESGDVVTSKIAEYKCKSKPIGDAGVVQMELTPGITGKFKIFATNFSSLSMTRPLNIVTIGVADSMSSKSPPS